MNNFIDNNVGGLGAGTTVNQSQYGKDKNLTIEEWIKSIKKEIKPDHKIVEKVFFDGLTDIGKAYFIAMRDSLLALVPPKYVDDYALQYMDKIAKKFVEKLSTPTLELEKIIYEIDEVLTTGFQKTLKASISSQKKSFDKKLKDVETSLENKIADANKDLKTAKKELTTEIKKSAKKLLELVNTNQKNIAENSKLIKTNEGNITINGRNINTNADEIVIVNKKAIDAMTKATEALTEATKALAEIKKHHP